MSRSRFFRTTAVIACGSLLAAAHGADNAPATQPSTPPAPTTVPTTAPLPTIANGLPDVIVRGRSEDLLGVASTASQGYIGAEELARRPILRPAEVLEAVPGLVITQHSGPGKANQYFLRGFQLDHGTDFAVTLEGVPQNLPSHAHGQGYLDLNPLIPELVDNIRYRKGPYSADVGDFSSAGSADIQYVNALPQGLAVIEAGSFGYARALVADSTKLGKGNLLYAFEYEHEDGPWKVPDAYKRINAVLKYSEGNSHDGYSITGMGYHGEWTATNQIAERAITSGLIDRFGSLDPSDGGNSQQYTLVAETHHRDTDSADHLLAFAKWYDMDLFNDFTYFLNDPVRGDQFEQQDRRFISGVRASHEWDMKIFGHTSQTTVGVQARNDDINNSLHLTEDRHRFATVRADHVLETSVGMYVENDTTWSSWFRTEISGRGDFYDFDVNSNIKANSGNVKTGIFSPKLNLVFGPWYDTELYISGGYGFHSNDARGVTTTEIPSTLVPTAGVTPLVRAKGAEIGIRTNIIPQLKSTVSFWLLDLDSEEVFDGDTAETVPGPPSRRYGVEISNFYEPTPWLTLDADYSLSQAKFTSFDPAGQYVPESITSVLETGITVHDIPHLKGLFGGLRMRYFGPRPLIENNSVQSNSSAIVNAQIGYQINKTWTLKADFLNLFNTQTNDIEYFYQSRLPGEPAGGKNDIHLHPAEPFQVRVSLVARF